MDETKGNSFANGPAEPDWLRKNWQAMLVLKSQTTRWTMDGSAAS